MSKVICIASAKGGSGKTILTATFADFLRSLGKSVLIIDTDAATNGLTLLYLKEVTIQKEYALSDKKIALGTYEFNSRFIRKEIVKLPNGVDLIPATYSFRNTENVNIEIFTANLSETINFYRDQYDFIFLDAQAGSDHFAHASMSNSISDEVIIVSEYDPLSAAGVERLKALFRDDLTYNRTWVLLNKMLPEFVQSFSDFLEVAKYLSPIPWDADIVKAYSRRKLATNLEFGNGFTLAVIQTLRGLLGDAINEDIDKWLKDKAEIVKTPLIEQYQDTIRLIDELYEKKKRSQGKIPREKVIYFLGLVSSLLIAIKVVVDFLFRKNVETSFKIEGIVLFILIISGLMTAFFYLRLFNNVKKSKYDDDDMQTYELNRLRKKLETLENLISTSPENLIKNRVGNDK